MAVAKNTALRREAEKYQYSLERTPEAKRSIAFWLVGIGAGVNIITYFVPWLAFLFPFVGWGGGLVAYFLGRSEAGAWVTIATILLVKAICVVLAIWGIAKLVSALRTPVKLVTCPFCSHSFRVFRDVKKVMCINCGQLMLLGDSLTSPEMIVAGCGYCGLQTAMAKDVANFPCPNCLIQRSATGAPSLDLTQECPACQRKVHHDACFCKECGKVLRKPYVGELFAKDFDMDWLIGKDADGYWRFASYLLNSLPQEAGQIQELHAFATPFIELKMAVLCSENALSLPGANVNAENVIAHLERTYAILVSRALRLVETNPDKKYEKGSLKCFTSPPYAAARKSLETRLPSLIPADARWAEQLLVVERTKFALVEKHRIVNYSALRKDAGRLAVMATAAR